MRYVDLSKRDLSNSKFKQFPHSLVLSKNDQKKMIKEDGAAWTGPPYWVHHFKCYTFYRFKPYQRPQRSRRPSYYNWGTPVPNDDDVDILYRTYAKNSELRFYFRTEGDALLFKLTWG